MKHDAPGRWILNPCMRWIEKRVPEEAQGPLSKGWLRPGVTQIGSTLEPGNGTEEGCRAIKATWQLDAGNVDKQAAVCLHSFDPGFPEIWRTDTAGHTLGDFKKCLCSGPTPDFDSVGLKWGQICPLCDPREQLELRLTVLNSHCSGCGPHPLAWDQVETF